MRGDLPGSYREEGTKQTWTRCVIQSPYSGAAPITSYLSGGYALEPP